MTLWMVTFVDILSISKLFVFLTKSLLTASCCLKLSSDESETEQGPEHLAESTHKGVNQLSKYVTQTQQRPESPTVTHLACV